MQNITIIGCGHGGQALAADLSNQGCQVTLYADSSHPGHSIQLAKTKYIRCYGKQSLKTKIYQITNNIKQAVTAAEIIFLVLPTNAHLPQFKKMLPHLHSGQTIISLAGNFSSLYLHAYTQQHAPYKKFTFADVSSLPYACRAESPGEINILDIKQSMGIATIPATDAYTVQRQLTNFFPSKLIVYKNVLELGINITSGISHPTIAIMNAGRIAPDKSDFYFYKDGITPEVANIIKQLDQDRQAIAQLYHLKAPSYLDLMAEFYGNRFSTYEEFFKHSPVHNALPLCPQNINERYLTQDIPFVLVPWYSLGKLAGYQSKTLFSLIQLASLLNQQDYLTNGKNLAEDIFCNMTSDEVCYYVTHGTLEKIKKIA